MACVDKFTQQVSDSRPTVLKLNILGKLKYRKLGGSLQSQMEKGRVTSRVFANRFRSRNGRFSNMRFACTRGTLVGYADVPARALHM